MCYANFLQQAAASPNEFLEWVKVISPLFLAIIALLSAAWTAGNAIKRTMIDKRYEYAGVILNHRIRQILDFYAPMRIYIEKSGQVYEKLRLMLKSDESLGPGSKIFEYDPATFTLLDGGSSLYAIEKYRGIIDEILDIGQEMTALIAKNGGLIEGGVTQIYLDYQGHYSILHRVIKEAEPIYRGPGGEKFQYYPRLLNREVLEGYKTVLAKVEEYIKAGDENIYKLLKLQKPEISPTTELKNLINNLEYYEYNAKDYAARFEHTNLSVNYSRFINELDSISRQDRANLKLLDIACGPGRDTQHFISEGFGVLAVDASPAMASMCRARIRNMVTNGNEIEKDAASRSTCIVKSFEEIDYQYEFDGIWAAAAFVHVPEPSLGQIIKRLGFALKRNGILYISLKHGTGTEQFLKRTFEHYDKKKISNIIRKIPSLQISGDVWYTEERDNTIVEVKRRLFDKKKPTRYWINILIHKL